MLQPFFHQLEILDLIGRGGMGAVYRAHQKSLGRDVALKILPPEIAATPGFVDRFLREGQALGRLGHPNIVAIYDHGTSGPYAYLIMELVEGLNLRELMAGERLPPDEAMRIVPQLCDALNFAHGRGVVHRDIKPENILLDESGRVRITDFGLAKITDPQPNPSLRYTATRQVMGTVHYMAPEQIETPGDVDHRADLYSLGVVFYELLTGELPLGRFSPPSRKAGTPKPVDKVVFKSLEKERERRYDSASDLSQDLDRSQKFFARGEDIAAAVQDAFGHGHGSIITLLLLAGIYILAPIFCFASLIVGPFSFVLFMAGLTVAVVAIRYRLAVRPLPEASQFLAKPIELAESGFGHLRRSVDELLESCHGTKRKWFLASAVNYLIGVLLVLIAFTESSDEWFLLSLVAFVIAWVTARMAHPGALEISGRRHGVFAGAPVLTAVVPLGLLFLFLPAIVSNAVIEANHLFRDEAKVVDYVLIVIALQLAWFCIVTGVVAFFPGSIRWYAKPLLNSWTGRYRWWVFTFTGFACICSVAIYAWFPTALR